MFLTYNTADSSFTARLDRIESIERDGSKVTATMFTGQKFHMYCASRESAEIQVKSLKKLIVEAELAK